MTFTTLKDLYYVEWFAQRWKVCITLNDSYAMGNFYNIETFGLRWIIEYPPFNECQV